MATINAFPSAASIGALPISIPGSNVRPVRARCYAPLGRLSSGVALQGLRGPVPAPQSFLDEVNAPEPAIYPDQSHAVLVAPEHLTALRGEHDLPVPRKDTGPRPAPFETYERFPRFAEVSQVGGEDGIGEEHGLFAFLIYGECLARGVASRFAKSCSASDRFVQPRSARKWA